LSQYGHQTDDHLLPVPLGQGFWFFDDSSAEGVVMSFIPAQFFQKVRDETSWFDVILS
jgi:hypothetical protein